MQSILKEIVLTNIIANTAVGHYFSYDFDGSNILFEMFMNSNEYRKLIKRGENIANYKEYYELYIDYALVEKLLNTFCKNRKFVDADGNMYNAYTKDNQFIANNIRDVLVTNNDVIYLASGKQERKCFLLVSMLMICCRQMG
jgi:hypothetical protein